MGFFSVYKKIDGAVNRGYARWGKWIWGALILPVVIYIGWSVWAAVWGPPSGPVTLIIHSEIDRPIRGFSVNGVAGANAFAHGGGKATCCGSISGNKAEIIWTVDYTLAQYKAGVRTEVHRLTMPLPQRKKGENDLHVHFLPGDKVLLGWSDNAWSPYETHQENANNRETK
ncbi:DUF3304 domain-containing protein [Enterobacter wuhouensis]|uniref:DUF3304 domain-containing protein n=1 Tax=Enterobacter wuhouensis TaxID=2529381 RepID=UPI003D76B366